jgi:4-nitrophenyl phosphatase
MTLAQTKAIIADMDGVLWRDGEPLPGLKPFFDFLRSHAIPCVLATNNSTKTAVQYAERLARFGVTVSPDHIITSSVATARYLQARQPGARVYPVGMHGLIQALQDFGFTVADKEVDFVVAGMDGHLTYEKIATANRLIRQGAAFIGTNPDRTFPTPNGPVPGAGVMLAAIETASGQAPVVIGKPSSFMFQLALEQLGTPPAQTAMLGDRLETDILGARRAGLRAILVCTGISTRADLPSSEVQPDLVFDGLPELLQQWRAAFSS